MNQTVTGARPADSARRRPKISLLHATYRRAGGPLEVRDAWLGRAVEPDLVEYIVAMDADDAGTIACTEGLTRLVNPAWPGVVTAVRNWNAAAQAATGDLLIVISDDLFPPPGWDQALIDMVAGLDPTRTGFAVKVADNPDPDDVLIRHPVVSRAFYTRFGLFSPAFRGLYCDNDFTTRAFWSSVILDGRTLRLEHRHPSLAAEVERSESHDRMNRREEYVLGQALYHDAWPRRKRYARPILVAPASPRGRSPRSLAVTQRLVRGLSTARFAARVPGGVARILGRRLRSRVGQPAAGSGAA